METVNTFNNKNTSKQGFALLMTIIVVSVIISIGLSVLDLTLKQVRLSTNAKDSEIAFHAANAGVECARYTRRVNSTLMEVGTGITPVCFGATASPNTVTSLSGAQVTGDGNVYKYTYHLSWSSGADQRCTQVINMVAVGTAMITPTTLGAGITTVGISTHIPGYPASAGPNWYCGPGERCTLLSVKGYNRACAASYGYGTVEREVLLQF